MIQESRQSLVEVAREEDEVRLDISPMVDVIFLLLLFFIVSSRLADEAALNINLPGTTAGQTVQSSPAELAITNDGRLLLDAMEVPRDGLEVALRDLLSESQNPSLAIRADTDARHGLVLEVYGLAQEVGFERLNVAVKRE